jgi:hypothetical protein
LTGSRGRVALLAYYAWAETVKAVKEGSTTPRPTLSFLPTLAAMAVQSKPIGASLVEWIRTRAQARSSIVLILALLYVLRSRLTGKSRSKALQSKRPQMSKRISSFAKEGTSSILDEVVRRPQPVTEEEMDAALQELYVENPDGSYDLLVPHRGRVSRVTIRETKKSTYNAHWKDFRVQPPILDKRRTSGSEKAVAEQKLAEAKTMREEGGAAAASAKKVGVNKEFFRQLRAIFRILIPSSKSKELPLFFLHTGFLLLRTYLSLLVARLDGAIVRDLVSANGRGFLRGLGLWFLLAIPSTYTNSMVSLIFRPNALTN